MLKFAGRPTAVSPAAASPAAAQPACQDHADWLSGPRVPLPLIRALILVVMALGGWYLVWRATASVNLAAWPVATLLFAAEVITFVGTILFALTLWRWQGQGRVPAPRGDETVDVFITTYNEPLDVVRDTLAAALAISFTHRTYVLDDGDRPEIAALADTAGAGYLTRDPAWRGRPRHAKAGNLINALGQTTGEFVLVLDADQMPEPAILDRTLGYFRRSRVAVVQTPQWFRNVAPGDPFGNQARLFYGPLQQGKDGWGAAFFCGSNALLRREALLQIGLQDYAQATVVAGRRVLNDAAWRACRAHRAGRAGAVRTRRVVAHALLALRRGSPVQAVHHRLRPELTASLPAAVARPAEAVPVLTIATSAVTEDLATTVRLHAAGWETVYQPEVLATGLAPGDLRAVLRQRRRWATGTMQVFLAEGILTRRGLSLGQRLMYLATVWSYLAGLTTIVFLAAPILFLLGGVNPLRVAASEFLWHFVPFLFVSQLLLVVANLGMPGWRARQYGMALFPVQLTAIALAVANRVGGRLVPFDVTPKRAQAGASWWLVWPQLAVMAMLLAAMVKGSLDLIAGDAAEPVAVVGNLIWAMYDVAALSVVLIALRASPGGEPIGWPALMRRTVVRRGVAGVEPEPAPRQPTRLAEA